MNANHHGLGPARLQHSIPQLAAAHASELSGRSVVASEYESISGLLSVLRRRWLTALLVFAITAGLGISAVLMMTPKYASTVTLELSPESQSETNSQQSNYSADEFKSEIQTDLSNLEADGLALSVIQALQLETQRPFSKGVVPAERGLPLDQAPRTRENLLKIFERNVKAASPADTRLINLTAENPDPVMAAKIANAMADTFIQQTLERRHASMSQSSLWLQKELGTLKQQVEQSERNLANYERATGLAGVQLTTSGDDSGERSVGVSSHNPVTERLFTLSQELTSAEANRISAETVYNLVKTQNPEVVLGLGAMSVSSGSGSSAMALTSDSGIELVRSFRAQLATLNREYASAAVKYGTANPRITELQQQINSVQGQMNGELERISHRAENAYLYAKQNESNIRQEFTKQQAEANALTDKTVQLQVLAQEAYSNRALYESLFSKMQTANLASGVRATKIDIVDPARPSGKISSPNYPKSFAVIGGASLLLALIGAFLREAFDETVRTARDFGEISHLPLFGYLPRTQRASAAALEGASELMDQPHSPFSEAIRALRTSILLSASGDRNRTFLVTSASAGEGKTTVTFNLAVAFAQQGARVLLIDCDLRNPDLHHHFGCPLSPGVSELVGEMSGFKGEMSGGDVANAIMKHRSLSSLYLLPSGKQPELPAELFGSERFDALVRSCAERFDYVLIDSPPILPVTDAAIIATKVNGVVAVVRARNTTRALLSALVHGLRMTQAPVMGFVLNDVREPALHGFYRYSYTPKERQLHAAA